jgi:hypothetical protein
MGKLSKYSRIGDFLVVENKEYITLTFEEIEMILGFSLPKSARMHRAFWANVKSGALSNGWMSVGYETYDVNMKNEIVNFRKLKNKTFNKATTKA